jgi:hypothetical protein
MTTNVPQDVLEDALLAGFEVFKRPDGSEGIETFDAGENITDDLLKFLQLRAQRQQGAEPVGTVGPMPGTQGFTMATFEASKVPVGTNLYTPPPQANALVAAAYRKAAEIVGELENKSRDNVISSALKIAKSDILSAIPADATRKLEEARKDEEWISVENSLPASEEGMSVPVWTWDGDFVTQDEWSEHFFQPAGAAVGGWVSEGFWFCEDVNQRVTHWKPRTTPRPPIDHAIEQGKGGVSSSNLEIGNPETKG